MDLELGNGLIEMYIEEIIVKDVRINKKDTLKPAFDVLPFWAKFDSEKDYLKLVHYGEFHIELEKGKILVDCKLSDEEEFKDKNTHIKCYYSYARL